MFNHPLICNIVKESIKRVGIELIYQASLAQLILDCLCGNHVAVKVAAASLIAPSWLCPCSPYLIPNVLRGKRRICQDLVGQSHDVVWPQIWQVVVGDVIMKEGPRWLPFSVCFFQIERIGLYVQRDHVLFVKLYHVEVRIFPNMAGDRPSIEVNTYVLVVKDALH